MWIRRRLDREEGRVYAALTLYRGTEADLFRKAPLWSVEVQFVDDFGMLWLGWGYRSAAWRLPTHWYAVRRLKERLTHA